jgi:hypothetical protein
VVGQVKCLTWREFSAKYCKRLALQKYDAADFRLRLEQFDPFTFSDSYFKENISDFDT